MDMTRSQQVVVILDCCYSGAIADWIKKGEGDIDFDELKAKGRVILASSSAAQVALQARDGLSLYTRYLVEGMEGAAYPGQGEWIVARDLHGYADRRLEIESKGGYPPKIIAEDTGFDLPIVRAPKPEPKLEYRKAVDRIFQELDQELGLEFSGAIEEELDRGRLDTRWRRLGISSEDAKTIEEQVQQPYLVRAEQRRNYADYFEKATKNGFLPEESARRKLKDIRENLLLGEDDADRIEQQLTQQLNLKSASTILAPETALVIPPSTSSAQTPLRYAQLEKHLENQEWKEADKETYRLMITTVGKKKGQYFNRADLDTFPFEDLRTLDQLWVKYSKTPDYPDGKWGFSIQKQIWQECGYPTDDNDNDWRRFGTRVGWRKGNNWVSYDNLSFDLEKSLIGELPVWRFRLWGSFVRLGSFSSLIQRLAGCSTNPSLIRKLADSVNSDRPTP
ncbi:MAG: GUN4 domain-containing protein [Drouetiella hepatica Uher 2000/2452]|uniref:GUN4 domain-containing protein n=1 Tax=Drouetiella hepatica Uher 2000/2452 TaxID=904376 RepID=A0A951QAJ3_9CYAN|nr:GUN4 domain-containing protein [Drouetiella hepatica Uher 2000/2452]